MKIKSILTAIGTILLGAITFGTGFLGGFLALLLAIIVAGLGVSAFTGKESWAIRVPILIGFALAMAGVIVDLLLLMEIIPPFIV